MNIIGIIVASHGEFSKAAVETVEMIAGKQENINYVTLSESTSLIEFESRMIDTYKKLNEKYSNILVLCDIYGGTPFNVVNKMKLNGYSFKAYTGFNLPILIDLSFASDEEFESIGNRIKETHSASLIEIDPKVIEEESSLDL